MQQIAEDSLYNGIKLDFTYCTVLQHFSCRYKKYITNVWDNNRVYCEQECGRQWVMLAIISPVGSRLDVVTRKKNANVNIA